MKNTVITKTISGIRTNIKHSAIIVVRPVWNGCKVRQDVTKM